MAGNTGKMTAAAVRARGERMRLITVHKGGSFAGAFIFRPGAYAVGGGAQFAEDVASGVLAVRVYATSYSLKYLLSVAGTLRTVPL